MRLLTLLLLVGVAQAQGLSTKAPGQAGQKRTNLLLQSNTMSSAPAAVPPWVLGGGASVTTQASPVPPGGGTWAAVSSPSAGSIMQSVTVPSGVTFTGSVYVTKSAGSGDSSFLLYAAGRTVSACTCSRSDAGACSVDTAATAGGCAAYATDITTTVTRLAATVTFSSAVTAVFMQPAGGRWNVSSATSWFSGAMLESGATKPSNLCVTTTAAKTCK